MERLTTKFNGGYLFNLPPKKDENDLKTHEEYIDKVSVKLGEYEDAEEQGLLPRFHLGDEFWTIRLGKVLKAKVVMLQQKKDGSWQYRFSQEITPEYHDTHNYKESEFGKRFFLAKEEAEQALAKMKEV